MEEQRSGLRKLYSRNLSCIKIFSDNRHGSAFVVSFTNLIYCRDKEWIEGLTESLLFGKEAAIGMYLTFWNSRPVLDTNLGLQSSPHHDTHLHTGN